MNFDQLLDSSTIWNILMRFYRCIEYYKLQILVFELSALDICKRKSVLAKVIEYLNEILRWKEY